MQGVRERIRGVHAVGGLTPRHAVGIAAAIGAVVTLASLLPLDSVAYRSATLHVAIETAAAFAALLGAVLLFGRFLRSPTASELVLAASLLLLGLTNLWFAAIPWIVDEHPGSFHTWAPVAARLVGAAGLVVGAWIAPRPVHRSRPAAAAALAVTVAVLIAVGGLGALLAPHLPVGIDPNLPPNPSGPHLVGEPSLLVVQVIALLLYAGAAAGFIRSAERTGDEFMSWLAAAATLAAFSRLNYFLFPSLNSEWVYTGDFLRLLFYVVILAGALREIAAYQRDLAELAVDRERRRIARDLHDGLAQELAFIIGQTRRLSDKSDGPAADIADAAERALDESRHAIATLVRPFDAPLDASVAQAAEDVASRHGVHLELELAAGLHAPDAVHDALVRIVREAMINAIRHGRASTVSVALEQRDGLRLTVEDDGVGLRAASGPGTAGFGLVSMRERAEALGGTLAIEGRAPHGVRIEVRLP